MKRRLLEALLVTVCAVAVLGTFVHNLYIVTILCTSICNYHANSNTVSSMDKLILIFQVKVMVLLGCGVQGSLQPPTPLVECRFITTVGGGTSVISPGTLVQMKQL